MFLSVAVGVIVWMGGVGSGDMDAGAHNSVVSSLIEAEGVVGIKGVACRPSEDGGRCEVVM